MMRGLLFAIVSVTMLTAMIYFSDTLLPVASYISPLAWS